jgi:two-component system, LytTR family, response regulator
MPLKALIVDDERLARKELIAMLAAHSQIEIAGEAEDVNSAIREIQRIKPDVIFLDIQMPGESGFDLLNRVDTQAEIVFVTAYDDYAIQAFEINALDYLLKPVNADRLAKALERLQSEKSVMPESSRPLTGGDRLFLMLDTRWKFIQVNTIICILAAGDYSEIITPDGLKRLSVKTMREWQSRLPEQIFFRIHRSIIINLDFIERIEEWTSHSFRIYLKGVDSPLPVSRRYAARLKGRFG